MGGAPHSTQMPRSLALPLLSWVLRRINSLRSGVWARWRSYSRRFSCLASSSAGVGSTRGFGVLGWGVAFFRLVVFCLALGFLVVALRGVVDFLGLTRRLGSSNGKLSTNICLLEGFIPTRAGIHHAERQLFQYTIDLQRTSKPKPQKTTAEQPAAKQRKPKREPPGYTKGTHETEKTGPTPGCV